MKKQNEIKAKKLSQTTDFLTSYGASCSTLTRIAKMSNEEIQQAIDASHPETLETSRCLAADQLAMMLIHNRHEKREIVNLIRWLLLSA